MSETVKAEKADAEQIVSLFEDARVSLRAQEIPQWQDGYPGMQEALQDIEKGTSYVIKEEGRCVAVASISSEPEKDYAIIDGKWLNEDPYIVIHRIAVLSTAKGKGYAHALLEKAEEIARETGIRDIRIDTHEKNIPMRSFLKKNGFVYCGIITLHRDGDTRRAYQLHL